MQAKNPALYTKNGELKKRGPHEYVIRQTKQPVRYSECQKIKLPGITFLVGPNGEAIDENPDYKEWLVLING